ncbi:hypothetical protein HPB50_008145 [Hyalomma asiaticum]|uniref:Uncharacterized protein n=1 Tax=Hyalomma asiaticum TaxID=266040 RepID=A0ACB7RPV7_HYAAI|nr:hypothetical protein HPB50_008145 [Hyalomma asiaticum]
MEVQVEGERIDPKDLTEDAGWRVAKYRRTPANKTVNPKNESRSALPGGSLASDPRAKPKGAKQRIMRAEKMSHLPTGDTKVVIRPKGGLNISKIGGPVITAAIFQATGIPEEERAADTICPNVQQNIIVVSMPSASNLHKYLRMKGFHVGGHMIRSQLLRSGTKPHDQGEAKVDVHIQGQMQGAIKVAQPDTTVRRSRSRSRPRRDGSTDKVSWADAVKVELKRRVSSAYCPSGQNSHDREMLLEMQRENAKLRELVQQLSKEIRELKIEPESQTGRLAS